MSADPWWQSENPGVAEHKPHHLNLHATEFQIDEQVILVDFPAADTPALQIPDEDINREDEEDVKMTEEGDIVNDDEELVILHIIYLISHVFMLYTPHMSNL